MMNLEVVQVVILAANRFYQEGVLQSLRRKLSRNRTSRHLQNLRVAMNHLLRFLKNQCRKNYNKSQ